MTGIKNDFIRSHLCGLFFFKKNWPFPASFFFISSFQYTVDSKQMFNINKFCQWLDSNRGPLVSEATALPTEPQPLPNLYELCLLLYLYTSEQALIVSKGVVYINQMPTVSTKRSNPNLDDRTSSQRPSSRIGLWWRRPDTGTIRLSGMLGRRKAAAMKWENSRTNSLILFC